MLIQQTVYLNTEDILIGQRQHFSLKDLSWKKPVQIFVVLLFLHYHTQTCILSCVFFNVFNFFPHCFGSSGVLFCLFFFSKRTQRLWIITLNKDTILEDLDC